MLPRTTAHLELNSGILDQGRCISFWVWNGFEQATNLCRGPFKPAQSTLGVAEEMWQSCGGETSCSNARTQSVRLHTDDYTNDTTSTTTTTTDNNNHNDNIDNNNHNTTIVTLLLIWILILAPSQSPCAPARARACARACVRAGVRAAVRRRMPPPASLH